MLICSYFVVHRCKIDIPAMYRPHARYHYWHGINWRAVVSLLTPCRSFHNQLLIADMRPRGNCYARIGCCDKTKAACSQSLDQLLQSRLVDQFLDRIYSVCRSLGNGESLEVGVETDLVQFPARESYVDHNIDSLEDESDSEKKQAGEDEEKDMAPAAEVSVVPVGDI